MVETIKGGDGLLKFDSAFQAGLDSRAFARWAACVGHDSEHISMNVPANPQPTGLQVLNCKLHGHPLGGTNVHNS
jgi:hypothetical protein